jgi:hypothetical protein
MSKAAAGKKNWADVDDEDRSNEPHIEKHEVPRTRIIEGKPVEEKVLITKYVYPVRHCVKDRKKLAKFGIPEGDQIYAKQDDKVVRILSKDDEESAIDLVDKLKQLDTAKMRQTRAQQELENAQAEGEEKGSKRGSNLDQEFGTIEQYSIRVSNIVPEQSFKKSDGNTSSPLRRILKRCLRVGEDAS